MADQGAVGKLVTSAAPAFKPGVVRGHSGTRKLATPGSNITLPPKIITLQKSSGVAAVAPGQYIGRGFLKPISAKALRMVFTPLWWGIRPIGELPYPEGGVSGQVYQRTGAGDVPLANCKVRLYYRPNGAIVGDTVTNSQGKYSFDLLMPEDGAYYAVALDPDGAPMQNGAIFDRLTPKMMAPIVIQAAFPAGVQGYDYQSPLPKTYYAVGILSWQITAGTLPAGLTLNQATGVISGQPTGAAAASLTLTVTDADRRSSSISFTLNVVGDVLRADTLQGRLGLAAISTAQTDDSTFPVGDIGFGFELGGQVFKSDIQVGSNSYVTFGYGSVARADFTPGVPGRALTIAPGDRSSKAIYAGAVTDGFRIRFEGATGTSGATPLTQVWELTLYKDNSMVLVTGALPTNVPSMLSDGVASLVGFTPVAGRAYLFQKDAAGVWSVRDYVKSTRFNKLMASLAPISWYRMNEQSGLVLTDSGIAKRDGVFAKDSSLVATKSLTADGEGSALGFAAATHTDFVDLRISGSPIDPANPFSISVIVRPTAKPNTPYDPVGTVVFMNNPGTSGGVGLDVVGTDSGYYFRLMRAGASVLFYTDDIIIPYGQPTFVTLVGDGNNATIWLNGKKIRSAPVSYASFTSAVRIGWADFQNANRYPFIGDMDELAFFNRALGDSEIQALYSAAMVAAVPPKVEVDPLFSKVRSLMPLSADLVDVATGAPAWTKTGNAVFSSEQTLFGKPTLKLDGSSLVSSTLKPVAAGMTASNDVTFEVFFYPTRFSGAGENNDYQRVVSIETNGDADMLLMRMNGGPYQMVTRADQQEGFINAPSSPTYNAWNHLVMQRKGNQWQMLANGKLIATRANINQKGLDALLTLGGALNAGAPKEFLTGFIGNFRMTIGAARYADGYTVPTAPFPETDIDPSAGDENTLSLLHFDGADQATTVTDETGRAWVLYNGAKLTTAAKKFGSASLQLSGKISGESNVSRAYSQLNENHTFGAEDFCVEIQAKQDQRTSAAVLACVDWEGISEGTRWKAWAIVIDSDGRPYCQFSNDGASVIKVKAADAVPTGSFVHYAMTREGGTLRFFVNGALAGTADVTNLIMWKPVIGITLGTWPTAQADGLVGQLDEFRMTRGKAVYTSAFTPPTAAFPTYVAPTAAGRPGAGYPLDGSRWFKQSDIQGPMMEARTLMIDFKVAQMPPSGNWGVIMQASYDGWGSPFLAVNQRQDLSYGDLGWYIRQGMQTGSQTDSGLRESNGNQVTNRRHRLLIVLKGTQPTNPNYSETVNADYILDGRTVNLDFAQSLLAMPDSIGRGTYGAGSGTPFIGNVYGVAIWKRTLTPAEQTRLWNDDSYDLAKYPGLLDAWLTRKVADGLVPNEVSGRPPLRLTTA